jgi:hypothetical protein
MNISKVSIKKQCIYLATSLLTLGVIIISTEPSRLPLLVLAIPFVLIFCIIYFAGITVTTVVAKSTHKPTFSRRPALLAAALGVSCIALQSTGQLTVRDVITLIILLSIIDFYLRRTSIVADKN